MRRDKEGFEFETNTGVIDTDSIGVLKDAGLDSAQRYHFFFQLEARIPAKSFKKPLPYHCHMGKN